MRSVRDHITNWLRQYAIDNGLNGFVVGVSGGIDSAVVSALCANTGLKTVCVMMPIKQSQHEIERAEKHVGELVGKSEDSGRFNVEAVQMDFTSVFDHSTLVLSDPDNYWTKYTNKEDEPVITNKALAQANLRARMRMSILYYIATTRKMLVVGTGNKVEDFGIGFFTKYGDGGVDVSPIADLYKTEVYNLGYTLGIIPEILTAKPTDGLWQDGRTDEEQIGATYPELEWAMMYLEQNVPKGVEPTSIDMTRFESLSDRQKTVLGIYMQRHVANYHKIKPIPVCNLGLAELMNFSEETMKLIDEYRFIRNEKNRIVRQQKYEEAARLRDDEKVVIGKLMELDPSGVLLSTAQGE